MLILLGNDTCLKNIKNELDKKKWYRIIITLYLTELTFNKDFLKSVLLPRLLYFLFRLRIFNVVVCKFLQI